MKRVALLLGVAAAAASSAALAQVPAGPASATPASPPAAASPPPAPAGGAPAPAPAGAAPAGEAPTAPVAPAPPAGEAPPAEPPGDQYYVDRAPGTPPGAPPSFEPPLPGRPLYEPPPPPPAKHVTPRSALWAGARLGWFFPFGNLWARGVPAGSDGDRYYYTLEGQPWRDYAATGPLLELDVGVRLSRSYTVFALWERAQLGSGDALDVEQNQTSKQDGAESDFWAIGLRANSNPDKVGFITEVAIGYRRARTFFENGSEYQFTEAPFEARLGLGAEYRLNRLLSFSAQATVGVGSFGSAQRVGPSDNVAPLTSNSDEGDGHGWATLNVGGHFDLFPSKN